MIDVAVDARALQDENFRFRGIGQHIAALLAGRNTAPSHLSLHAITDPNLPDLAAQFADLFDTVQRGGYAGPRSMAILSPSPMTHSPLSVARLMQRSFFSAAIVYDFIPLDFAEHYLDRAGAPIDYANQLAWLRHYDHLYPISAYTARRLQALFGVSNEQVTVTGIAVREGLLPRPDDERSVLTHSHYFLVASGDDWRKNVECPIAAHARSAVLGHANVRLVVGGGFSVQRQNELYRLHGTLGGNPNLLEFAPRLTDEALRLLYAQAIATITPSRAEGFSMPIIEASANGCPVIAANCDAQAELLGDPRDLFAADDVTTLQLKLESFYQRPELREQARARQSGLGLRFEQSIISRRFWSDFSTQIERRARNPRRSRKRSVPAPAVLRKVKPRVAFLTPLPPDPSGVADFSAATLAALAHRANVSVFSSTKDPVMPDGVCRDIRPVSAMPYLRASHDAVVSVVGNSHFHLEIFHQMMRWGSASIAHDARMLNFYSLLLGEQRTIAVASAELGRPVTADEIQKWLMDQHSLPALFLDEIAGMSHPLMMHSRLTAEILRSRGIATVTLPFSPYRVLPDEALSPDAKRKARENLMLPQDDLIVATFGNVSPDRAIEDGLWAVEFLRAWGFPARLACIGPVKPEFNRYLNNIAASIGMQNYLFLTPDGVSEHVYRLWLSAADVAFQLRTYKLGGLSGALLDCIAAGLPTVANLHLAEAMEAPEWVRRVPDGISAVLIAEQLAAIIAEGIHRARPLAARAALLKARGFDVYATRLMEGLGFEQPQKRHRARSER